MTLEDCEIAKMQDTMMQKSAGSLLVKILKQAMNEKRVISGMYGAAQSLGRDAQNVMMCILPQNRYNSDVAHHINQMLMEAYCNENDICIFKVDSEKKLADFFVNNDSRSGEDFSCVLVQSWSEGKSLEEDALIHMCHESGIGAQFVIELPGP